MHRHPRPPPLPKRRHRTRIRRHRRLPNLTTRLAQTVTPRRVSRRRTRRTTTPRRATSGCPSKVRRRTRLLLQPQKRARRPLRALNEFPRSRQSTTLPLRNGNNVDSSLECLPVSDVLIPRMTWSTTACFDAYFWYRSPIRKIAKGVASLGSRRSSVGPVSCVCS